MTLFIESVVLCVLFTVIIYATSRDPLQNLYNYPPNIQKRVQSMEVYQGRIPTQEKKIVKKLLAVILITVLFALILKQFNGCDTFIKGFGYSFLLWTVVNAYDAIVMDIMWFCHDPHFVLEGTEDMVSDYHDYWFHVMGSLKGELLALPVCVLVGLLVQFVL